jgi:hypothetical protein
MPSLRKSRAAEKPALNFSDINKITMDYFYQRPEAILAGLQGAAEHDDKEMVREILLECEKRGIDVVKLIQDDIDRHERLWGRLR